MARKHHYRRPKKEPPELNITTFLNLMVVLVPFLLITAVFSRMAVIELSLPVGGSDNDDEETLTIEVIVRETGLELSDGKQILETLPLLSNIKLPVDSDGTKDISKLYDIKSLADYLVKLKKQHPAKTDALVLMEEDVEYRSLIRIMDSVRSTFVREKGEEGEGDVLQQMVLFPDISIGDAPVTTTDATLDATESAPAVDAASAGGAS
jgi:biopolymer transport protein ExbD